MESMILPVFIMCVVVFVFGLFLMRSRNKKMILNEKISSEYANQAYQILSSSPEISKARAQDKILNFFTLLLLLLMLVAASTFIHGGSYLFLIGAFASGIGFIVLNFARKNNALFDKVIPKILSTYNDRLIYQHNNGIDSNVYDEAHFENWDRYNSEDMIVGTIKNCNFAMSEVHTQDRYTDSEGRTSYRTLFRGTFAVIDLNKDFASWISIVNNKIKLFSKDNYISLENTEFEKIYDVFTDDKIKAMRLLTPDVTTKMIHLYNETGLYCEIKIINKKMYIRLYTSGLFEVAFSNPKKESKQIGACIAVIDNIFKVTENFIDELERFDV